MATQAHIDARIANASDYTLLSGTASVSVGGRLISRSDVPALSSKKASTGRSASTSQSEKPTTASPRNSRSPASTPRTPTTSSRSASQWTSQNGQIEIKLVNPALRLPSGISNSINLNHIIDMKESIHDAGAACRARVRGAADEPTDRAVEALGLDRKLNWVCSVGAQAKINLALEWEVTVSPASVQAVGL
ncbi:hypothetical protein DFH08DRAFT_1002861 [Mycena albidolilacea]|uniref:Uncharacterized protein n=1 Tax=Mycena albidolilacea TaxID=1033008 RepID=A0AAD7F4P7_9AGAR|nr:hypothetical protein DFH08DRAFT_1002861 [Mycena albidolilacea]